MLVLDDHQGGMSIGRPLEYLEPTEEVGVFRLVKDADRTEGIGFTIKPRVTATGGILFEPLGGGLQPIAHRNSTDRPLLLPGRPEARVMKPETLEEINQRVNKNTPEGSGASEEESGSPE